MISEHHMSGSGKPYIALQASLIFVCKKNFKEKQLFGRMSYSIFCWEQNIHPNVVVL